ncbi:MAG: hypothetical protein QOE20_107 [Mycobacterium sp.]|nr:hypothetical protein [Mycobacterium sp.]
MLVHAVLGCLFYGVFVTKMLLLTRKGWAIPVAGGLLFMTVVLVWLVSALVLPNTRAHLLAPSRRWRILKAQAAQTDSAQAGSPLEFRTDSARAG